jgi:hypothetical protein
VTPQDADARRMRVVGLVLLALGAAGLVALFVGWRPGVESWRGDLLQTSVSPDGRWEAQAYELNPGAMASEKWRVQVRDLHDPGSEARNVYYEYGLGELSWSGPDTLVVASYSTKERRELDLTSADEVSVGPDPWSKDSLDEILWLVVFGPVSLLLALLGVLLLVAGSMVKRAFVGSRAAL